MEAIDLVKEERQKIINEYERLEMQAFESDFNSLIQESTQTARKETQTSSAVNTQKREILIPFSSIKNKIE
jgi:hypothetical protein